MISPIVYTVGRVIVDLYATDIAVPLDEVFTFRKYVGGSSGNTAIGLARLGNRTGVIARVGDDPMGHYIIDTLQREGIDTRMVRMDSHRQTGIAFAALYPPGDSHVWFCGNPNANSSLAIEDLDFNALREARAIVIAGTGLAREPSRSAVLGLAMWAKEVGIPIILDVDWRPVFWRDPDRARLVYDQLLAMTHIVLANEPELALVGESHDMTAAAAHVLEKGVSEVVAKRGEKGAWSYRRNRDAVFSPAFTVQVLNTLGAGDGFAAGYVHGLLAGWNVEKRLQWANACGAIVVTRHSCSDAMPKASEVQALWERAEAGGTIDE
ncbi:MAG: 5-dehydro-2-deoxygluconokinase [Firmicutes bacterium]|nr:5-dehydro-2-deoxygluconokinase [Bacillota bacterium]